MQQLLGIWTVERESKRQRGLAAAPRAVVGEGPSQCSGHVEVRLNAHEIAKVLVLADYLLV